VQFCVQLNYDDNSISYHTSRMGIQAVIYAYVYILYYKTIGYAKKKSDTQIDWKKPIYIKSRLVYLPLTYTRNP
jgi:hypothetical protein